MSIPNQVAETVQIAHIKRHPSPSHDLAPSTTASPKEPVTLSDPPEEIDVEEDDDDIPVSILKPRPRNRSFPPMPDLRFEQSYLRSIEKANTLYKVALITVRDQMMMPLLQGLLWNLVTIGWQHWNRNAQYSGSSVGARIRRWWYGINNWPIPANKTQAS